MHEINDDSEIKWKSISKEWKN